MLHRAFPIVVATTALIFATGCQTSRLDKLRSKSDKVESSLKKERNRVLTAKPQDSNGRIAHLSSLHNTKSMADIALAAVPLVIPSDQRDVAYDVLDEAYDTIDWNIPLGPSDPKRAMPAQLQGSLLRLN